MIAATSSSANDKPSNKNSNPTANGNKGRYTNNNNKKKVS